MTLGLHIWKLQVIFTMMTKDWSSLTFVWIGFQILWKYYPLVNWYIGRKRPYNNEGGE